MRTWGKTIASLCLAGLCAPLAAITATVAVAAAPAAKAPPPLPPLRTERVFLTSVESPGGKATALFGFWFKGKGKSDKKPTIIAMHGCGGLYSSVNKEKIEFTPRHIAMARALTDAGYNVLFPDSFTPRGRRSICQETLAQREASSANRRYDVQIAMRWLATQDDVDYARIGMVGWSHGATTMLAALNLAQTDVAVRKVQPKAAVAFYPTCTPYAGSRTPYKPAAPMLILMGENDDWTPPEACESLEKKTEGSDTGITLRLYPDTYHDFDAPGLPIHVRMDIPGVGKRGEGVTSGGNADSRAEAYREMLKFLKDKLE
ncbi:dienelactone hydrolase family protein [Herbaspirillum rhizosphaerae]|uniref:Dienelactone hydrolase family protein n=1 Tax=Herbaspirillum rhizosphaerae TaxID=346179 RepID=A0ABW8Z432_9BURK